MEIALKKTEARGNLFLVYNGAANLDWIEFRE